MEKYGIELILDLHGCDPTNFTRESITAYFDKLCVLIDMKREDLHFWDDVGLPEEDRQTSPHTQGTSAVQFILTSSIVIHKHLACAHMHYSQRVPHNLVALEIH